MIRFTNSLMIAVVSMTLAGTAFAQRPQGTTTNMTDVVTVGTDLVGLSKPVANGTRILRSTDAGDSYTQIYEAQALDELHGLGVNGDVVLAVGTAGILRRSDFSVDPTIWTDVSTVAIAGDLFAADARATGVWIVAGAKTFRSIDNGLNWTEEDNASDDQVAVLHVSGDIWLTAGGVGGPSMRRSTDNGDTWAEVNLTGLTFAQGLISLAMDSAGNVLAVGEWGTVLYSTDQGASFTEVANINFAEDVNDVISTGADEWVLALEGGSLFSVQTNGAQGGSLLFEQTVGSDSNVTGITELDGAVVMAGTEAVAAPTLSGDPASFNNPAGPVEITINGTGNLFYTDDGSAPDNTDTAYAAPFNVVSNLTVKAVAESGGIYSAVVSQAVTAGAPLELSIAIVGADVIISTDTSVVGTDVQLQGTTDLTNPGGWANVQAPQAGTGASLQWTINPIPTDPTFWRAIVTESGP